jgi:hypothetical protein
MGFMARPDLRATLIKAVDLALAGDWAAAHDLVDDIEDDTTACWLHACLHKMEPDETNARYWYRRSSQFYESFADPKAELAAIKAALTY